MSPAELRAQRAHAYRAWLTPLLRYVLASGFGLLVGAVAIGSAFAYADWLKRVPPDFPAEWIGAGLCALLLWVSPIRTFLKEPDGVFLVPMEARLGPYFAAGLRSAFLWQSALLIAAFGVFWQLYAIVEAGADRRAFLLYAVLLAVAKGANVLAAWSEDRMREDSHRRLFRLLRLALCVGAAYVLLRYPLDRSGLFTLLVWLTLLVSHRLVPRYQPVHWSRLARLEQLYLHRMRRFLRNFVDLDDADPPARGAVLPGRLAGKLTPYGQGYAYLHLYTATLLRSELPGMLLRLAGIHWLISAVFLQEAVIAASLVLLGIAGGVQLRELERRHRLTFWTYVYPLPPGRRALAAARVALGAHLVLLLVLAPALLLAPVGWLGGAALLAAALHGLWNYRSLTKGV